MACTIGVDIGGTKVAGGLVDGSGKVLAQVRRSTPSQNAAAGVIIDVIRELVDAMKATAVGLGVAGFVDEKRSTMLFAPNMTGWEGVPLRDVVEQEIGLPVVIENDANAAAWGEAVYGAGRGESNLVCVTVGTGIGGGVVLGGQLYRGRWGFAGELGHMAVEPDGRPCPCGQRGCWEGYANGKALVQEARSRAVEQREEAQTLLALGDGTPEGITGVHITEAARRGDPVACAAFNAIATWLGQGLANLAAVLDPGCFVIGGGVSEAGELLLAPTRTAFATALTGRVHRPLAELRQARLGNAAGIVGVANLASLGSRTCRHE
jgi:glucokinase